jgi:hypothetical protein
MNSVIVLILLKHLGPRNEFEQESSHLLAGRFHFNIRIFSKNY